MINKHYFISAFIAFILLTLSFLPIFEGENAKNAVSAHAASTAVQNNYSQNSAYNQAESAIVIDAESGSILYSQNAHQTRGMASTTKIMTALVAIENCELDTEFNIPKEAVGVEGSSVYLIEGEPLTMRELLYCVLLESGNDAATAVAICCAGSEQDFVDLMNARAEEMGLESTHFSNPHGLSDEAHRTTAYELAMITAEAMKYPIFNEIVSTKTKKVRYDGVENGRALTNHNKLLFGYDGATGVKTGYTKADGKCLVSSAERNGLKLICVTLHDNSPTANHVMLLNSAFAEFEKVRIASAGEIFARIPIAETENDFLTVSNAEDISVILPKGAEFKIELILPPTVTAPIEENEIIAQAKCFSNGSLVYIINLESTETIKEKKKSFWEKLFGD